MTRVSVNLIGSHRGKCITILERRAPEYMAPLYKFSSTFPCLFQQCQIIISRDQGLGAGACSSKTTSNTIKGIIHFKWALSVLKPSSKLEYLKLFYYQLLINFLTISCYLSRTPSSYTLLLLKWVSPIPKIYKTLPTNHSLAR